MYTRRQNVVYNKKHPEQTRSLEDGEINRDSRLEVNVFVVVLIEIKWEEFPVETVIFLTIERDVNTQQIKTTEVGNRLDVGLLVVEQR